MPIEVRQIRTALAVSGHRSFRQAAEALGVSQPVVSQTIKSLEDELGVSLFERHSGGVRLTTAGRVFLAESRQALGILDKAVDDAGAAGRGEVGVLRAGYVWSVAAGPANDLLAAQRRRSPDVEVVLKEDSVINLATALLDRSLDIALLVGDMFPRRLDTWDLWTERLFFACGMADDGGRGAGWDVLEKAVLLVGAWNDWDFLQRIAFRAGGPKFNVQTHGCSRDGILGLVAAGRGIAVVPESTTLIPFPAVRFLPIADENAHCEVRAAWLNENDNPALRQLLSLLRTRYPAGGGNRD
jgi:DNA-binding transcriptional LysR family regulator